MKHLISLLLFLPAVSYANCKEMNQVALDFSNLYIGFLKTPGKWSDQWPNEWIQSNEYLTDEFKLSYKAIMTKAFINDSDFGLGFDPILDAQDYPNSGFVVTECDASNRRVLLQGREWVSFKLIAELKEVNNQWLVNKMGVVNDETYLRQMNNDTK
tara:strand:+ start:2217 stop:2684 length:468 start_codon:yes stop_codon:yes gene_type:complete